MRPVIGYNYGAGEKERVKKIYRLTLYMTGSIMILGTILCLLASGQLIGFFTTNSETIRIGQTALRVISRIWGDEVWQEKRILCRNLEDTCHRACSVSLVYPAIFWLIRILYRKVSGQMV